MRISLDGNFVAYGFLFVLFVHGGDDESVSDPLTCTGVALLLLSYSSATLGYVEHAARTSQETAGHPSILSLEKCHCEHN